MKNYKHIKQICQKNQRLSREVIDEFLLHYAADREKLEPLMNRQLAKYRHITSLFDSSWVNMIKAQYISHKIFKSNGFIKKFLNHSQIKDLTEEERNYIKYQANHPWRFSFGMITGNPEADFFEMEDVFRQESFLLYSPGVSGIMEKERPIMWFNLIAFNGECWETYGPIHYYKGFEPEDIFFFATELNPDQYIEDDEDVIADIEKNPIPYMMLFSGGNIPITVHREDQIVCYAAWYDMQNFKTAGLEQDFKIEYNAEVYRLSLKGWDEYPHFSTAYYDEKEEELFLSSMTDRGFDALTGRFNSLGYNFAEEADVRVNPVMLSNAGRILGKKITLDEYAVLFKRESSPEAQAEINKINDFMQMALPYINAGETPDVEDLAKNAGVDIETARDLLQHVMNKFDDMDKRRNG